jgi:hypothetical protein
MHLLTTERLLSTIYNSNAASSANESHLLGNNSKPVLKLLTLSHIIRLKRGRSPNMTANFFPIVDYHLYGLAELVELVAVHALMYVILSSVTLACTT